nr:SigE family RNA polymerase sigma factor [Nocardioides lijunqiniae]
MSRTAYLLTGDAHLAEDLVQTALFKAAKAWHRIEGDPEPYVRRILYTQNVSWWRQRRLQETALGSYDGAAPGVDADLRLSLEQALARLTTRQRTVLVLRYFEDLTEVQTGHASRHPVRHRQVDLPPGAGPAAHPVPGPRRADRGRVMSLDRLRDELARLGDSAPVAQVDHDTWQRAGRARRRDRIVVAGSVLAVALLAGALTWLPDRVDPPVADSAGGAVPDRVHLAPARFAERSGQEEAWAYDDLETDLALGLAAVAYVMEGGLPVLVDADDGDYHLLDLPGFVGNNAFLASASGMTSDLPLALSPDGTKLAYAFATIGNDAAEEPIPSGVRIVDLVTGDLREIALTGGEGVLVAGFDWSPQGAQLAWHGDEMASWTRYSLGGKAPVAGVIGRDDSSFPLPVMAGSASVSYAPADDGTVAVIGDNRMVLTRAGARPTELRVGDRFTVGAAFVDDVLHDVRSGGGTAGTRGYSVHLDPTRERLDFPDRGMASRTVDPLGWIDARHLVARVTGPSGETGQDQASELAVIEVGDDPSYDVVGTLDAGVPPVSVATDLMTLDQPTVERPEPDWPWSTRRWLVMIAVGALAVLAAVRLASRFPRRRLR